MSNLSFWLPDGIIENRAFQKRLLKRLINIPLHLVLIELTVEGVKNAEINQTFVLIVEIGEVCQNMRGYPPFAITKR